MIRTAIRPRFQRLDGAPVGRDVVAGDPSAALVREFDVVAAGRRMRPARQGGLADGQADRGGRDERCHAAEHEDEPVAAHEGGAERADRGPEQQPAHLRRAVQAEGLAAPGRFGRVGEEAPGGGVVRGRGQPGRSPQQDERERSGQDQGEGREDAGCDEPDHHDRHPRGAVGQPPECRFAHEPRRRPGGDDQPERRQVDALLLEVERQDREQRAEPEPHDELGGEQRDDRAPAIEPRRGSGREPGTRGPGSGRHGETKPTRVDALLRNGVPPHRTAQPVIETALTTVPAYDQRDGWTGRPPWWGRVPPRR